MEDAKRTGSWGGTLMWLGHYTYLVASATSLGLIACVALRYTEVSSAWPLPPAVLVLVIVGWEAERAHRRRLCLRCMRGVPFADPQGEVRRRHRALRVVHWAPLWRARLVAAWLALVVWVWALLLDAGADRRGVLLVQVAVLAVWGLLVFTAEWAGFHHRRLQPWCPYCRGDDGGEDVVDPEPVSGPGKFGSPR